jgi:sigma-B regulation protein RsbU (phosphoserine phosphatase)
MAKKDARTSEQIIKQLQLEIEGKERELNEYRDELAKINVILEKFINQLGGELKLAALIQQSLVPTEIPAIPGFEFSTKFVASPLIGGDYFDIFEMQDKMKFGVLMAHSSGHGMASLFMSVLLKLTTQIEAKKGLEPDEVFKHMAKEIQQNIKESDSANVFYAVINRRDYSLNFSCSGSVQAYAYNYAHDKLVRLDSTQSPIGKKSKLDFKVEMISLEPRDKLILTTDGVAKAKNKTEKEFGEEKLHQLILKDPRVSCHDLRNEILFQTSKWADGQDYPQDISVLIMEVKDKVIRLRRS